MKLKTFWIKCASALSSKEMIKLHQEKLKAEKLKEEERIKNIAKRKKEAEERKRNEGIGGSRKESS